MPPEFFHSLLSSLKSSLTEVTVEVNPEDVNLNLLESLKTAGINRLSIGVQSFSNKLLKILERRHSAEQTLKALEQTFTVFQNVSVDLMFGIPQQTLKDLENDLNTIAKFPIKHVSAYLLTLYEGTKFHKTLKQTDLPSENTIEEMYSLIREFLLSKGFNQYEISNFSISGYECKHNINYWKLRNYEGLGPSAASFKQNVYEKNVPSITSYISKLKKGTLPVYEKKTFNKKELLEIKIAMGLRLTSGINLKELNLEEEGKIRKLKELIEEGFLNYQPPILKIESKGYLVSNYLISKVIEALLE